MKFLRDPIWGALGVLVALITILITRPGILQSEIAIIDGSTYKFSDYLLPPDKLRLTFEDVQVDMANTDVSFFYISNDSGSAIKSDDFISNISIESLNKHRVIVYVGHCQENDKELCSALTQPGNTSNSDYVSLEWKKVANKWSMSPALLNADDQSCIIVISRLTNDSNEYVVGKDFKWTGRVLNTKLKRYYSISDYWVTKADTLTQYLNVSVQFVGMSIVWFVVLQYVFFIVTAYIASRAGWVSMTGFLQLNKIYIVILFSITSAEIAVSAFISGVEQNPIVWPLLFSHTVLFAYLIFKTFRKSN